eukprot:7367918-Pyramimonas_sp.AAC.1
MWDGAQQPGLKAFRGLRLSCRPSSLQNLGCEINETIHHIKIPQRRNGDLIGPPGARLSWWQHLGKLP